MLRSDGARSPIATHAWPGSSLPCQSGSAWSSSAGPCLRGCLETLAMRSCLKDRAGHSGNGSRILFSHGSSGRSSIAIWRCFVVHLSSCLENCPSRAITFGLPPSASPVTERGIPLLAHFYGRGTAIVPVDCAFASEREEGQWIRGAAHDPAGLVKPQRQLPGFWIRSNQCSTGKEVDTQNSVDVVLYLVGGGYITGARPTNHSNASLQISKSPAAEPHKCTYPQAIRWRRVGSSTWPASPANQSLGSTIGNQ